MSLIKPIAERVFSCPHERCKYKLKKFDSVESLNKHWAKIHSRTTKLTIGTDNRVYLRIKAFSSFRK